MDLYQRPYVHISGVTFNRDNVAATFNLDIEQWASVLKAKPVAPFYCYIPDLPHYKTAGRPVPYNGRYVSVCGQLSNVVLISPAPTSELQKVERFVVTVDNIAFLGTQQSTSDGPATSKNGNMPNTLNKTPVRLGFGYKHKMPGSSPFTPAHVPFPSTSTPESLHSRKPDDSGSSNPHAAKRMRSSTQAPKQTAGSTADHDNIYA